MMPNPLIPPLGFQLAAKGQLQLELAPSEGGASLAISNVSLTGVTTSKLTGRGDFAISKVYSRIYASPSAPVGFQNPWDDPSGNFVEGTVSGGDEKTWTVPFNFSPGQAYTAVVWLLYRGSATFDHTSSPHFQIVGPSTSSSSSSA